MLQQHRQRSVEDDCHISTRARMSHQVLDTAQLLECLFRDGELHLVSLSAEGLDEGRLRRELHHRRLGRRRLSGSRHQRLVCKDRFNRHRSALGHLVGEFPYG